MAWDEVRKTCYEKLKFIKMAKCCENRQHFILKNTFTKDVKQWLECVISTFKFATHHVRVWFSIYCPFISLTSHLSFIHSLCAMQPVKQKMALNSSVFNPCLSPPFNYCDQSQFLSHYSASSSSNTYCQQTLQFSISLSSFNHSPACYSCCLSTQSPYQ